MNSQHWSYSHLLIWYCNMVIPTSHNVGQVDKWIVNPVALQIVSVGCGCFCSYYKRTGFFGRCYTRNQYIEVKKFWTFITYSIGHECSKFRKSRGLWIACTCNELLAIGEECKSSISRLTASAKKLFSLFLHIDASTPFPATRWSDWWARKTTDCPVGKPNIWQLLSRRQVDVADIAPARLNFWHGTEEGSDSWRSKMTRFWVLLLKSCRIETEVD